MVWPKGADLEKPLTSCAHLLVDGPDTGVSSRRSGQNVTAGPFETSRSPSLFSRLRSSLISLAAVSAFARKRLRGRGA